MIDGMSVRARQRVARTPEVAHRDRVLRRRRRRTVLLLLVVGIGVVALAVGDAERGSRHAPPSGTLLSLGEGHTLLVPLDPGLSPLRRRIVTLAEGQIGYTTEPSNTYCNKYSAYWYSGTSDCGNANLDEEWCADFAAWVWQKAGAEVTYQYVNGDL